MTPKEYQELFAWLRRLDKQTRADAKKAGNLPRGHDTVYRVCIKVIKDLRAKVGAQR